MTLAGDSAVALQEIPQEKQAEPFLGAWPLLSERAGTSLEMEWVGGGKLSVRVKQALSHSGLRNELSCSQWWWWWFQGICPEELTT